MDFDVNKYREGLKNRINQAYEAYDVLFSSNITGKARETITLVLDDYISLVNRKIFNTYSYGEPENVSSISSSN